MLQRKVSVYAKMRIAWEEGSEEVRKALDPPLAQEALDIQSCEQAAADGNCWILTWHLCLLEAPEAEMYWRAPRPRQVDPLATVPSVDPRWGSALLTWLGGTESMHRRRAAIDSHLPTNAGLQQAAPPERLEAGTQPGPTAPAKPKNKPRRRLPYQEWIKTRPQSQGQQQQRPGRGGQTNDNSGGRSDSERLIDTENDDRLIHDECINNNHAGGSSCGLKGSVIRRACKNLICFQPVVPRLKKKSRSSGVCI